MPIVTRFEYILDDLLIRYIAPEETPDALGLLIVPVARIASVLPPREHLESHAVHVLPDSWLPIRAWTVDPLVHVRRQSEAAAGGFSQGRTLRGGPTTLNLRLAHHESRQDGTETLLRTVMADGAGLEATHEIRHLSGESGVRVSTTVRNAGAMPFTLELLTAFSLGGLTPFAADDAADRLHLHRARATWSAEGRPVADSFERLSLEPSWSAYGVACERFGTVGSMPVNGWHPFAAIEDRAAGVVWAAQIACPASWQMEVYRRADQAAFSGGGADLEFGHWKRTLEPGESHSSPEALLTTVAGTVDDACEGLTSMLRRKLVTAPESELELPVIFNEWCTSWGNPTHENLIALADRLQGSGVRYLVIDDGWAERPGAGIQQNGDWDVNRTAFPGGLRATCDALRARGFTPGIWFEFEICTRGSRAWEETSHQLHRDGIPLEVGTRRFWDFRDPWVHDYLDKKVICLLRENGFGYLKVDYNDTIGMGCDGSDSLGEGLREHLEGVRRFFRRLREALPDLVIENCSSGGHRLEPGFLSLTSMSSFSDAHESSNIPIIAANTLRLIPAAQNQIWAVLHAADSRQRLAYSLSAAFLGRMCLSGEIHSMPAPSWEFTREAVNLYRELAPIIAAGSFRRVGTWGDAWQHPTGWQAVVAHDPATNRAFVVWHTFDSPLNELVIPLPQNVDARAVRTWSDTADPVHLSQARLTLPAPGAWRGGVIVIQ